MTSDHPRPPHRPPRALSYSVYLTYTRLREEGWTAEQACHLAKWREDYILVSMGLGEG